MKQFSTHPATRIFLEFFEKNAADIPHLGGLLRWPESLFQKGVEA
ncbi:hypothetical protein [Burkholderia latens]|nr:hypothetical protein [Burkholderia latens]